MVEGGGGDGLTELQNPFTLDYAMLMIDYDELGGRPLRQSLVCEALIEV